MLVHYRTASTHTSADLSQEHQASYKRDTTAISVRIASISVPNALCMIYAHNVCIKWSNLCAPVKCVICLQSQHILCICLGCAPTVTDLSEAKAPDPVSDVTAQHPSLHTIYLDPAKLC